MLLLLFLMMFTLAQTRETLLRHATNATGDRSSVDAVDARWQICSMGTHRLPQADVCKIGFSRSEDEETLAGRATCWTVLAASNPLKWIATRLWAEALGSGGGSSR